MFDWAKKKKTVKVLVTLSIPKNMTPAQARREMRYLVNEGCGFLENAGEIIRVRKMEQPA